MFRRSIEYKVFKSVIRFSLLSETTTKKKEKEKNYICSPKPKFQNRCWTGSAHVSRSLKQDELKIISQNPYPLSKQIKIELVFGNISLSQEDQSQDSSVNHVAITSSRLDPNLVVLVFSVALVLISVTTRNLM